jgi:hypothetical protein
MFIVFLQNVLCYFMVINIVRLVSCLGVCMLDVYYSVQYGVYTVPALSGRPI